MIQIRPYTPNDYAAVAAILKDEQMFDDVWDAEENFAGMIDRDPQAIFVATDDGTVIGSIILIPYGPLVAFLYRFAIKHAYRKKGIGSRLLTHAEAVLKKKGVKSVVLFINGGKQDLLEYYGKRKFETTKTPFLCMWKLL
jgi:ribosomal protein S18 acetylase RimI-like enzyme